MLKKLIIIFILSIVYSSFAFSQDRPILTVLDFTANDIAASDMNAIISFLSSSIFETKKFEVIDKAQRDVILAELSFSLSGCADESCQLEVGKLLTAEYIVVGDVSMVGSSYILNAKIIETETSRTINTAKGIFSSIDELLNNINNLAIELSIIENEEESLVKEPIVSSNPEELVETVIENDQADNTEIVMADNGLDKTKSSIKTIATFSTLGVGAVAAVTGGILIFNALTYKTDIVDPAYSDAYLDDNPNYGAQTAEAYFAQKYTEYNDVFDVFKNKSILALTIAGGGILSLGASVLLYLSSERDQSAVSLHVQPSQYSMAFSINIRK